MKLLDTIIAALIIISPFVLIGWIIRRLLAHRVTPYYPVTDREEDVKDLPDDLKKTNTQFALSVAALIIALLSMKLFDNLPIPTKLGMVLPLFAILTSAVSFFAWSLMAEKITAIRVWQGAVIKYGYETAKKMAENSTLITNPQIKELEKLSKTKEKETSPCENSQQQ